jgi:hypothetical protein
MSAYDIIRVGNSVGTFSENIEGVISFHNIDLPEGSWKGILKVLIS